MSLKWKIAKIKILVDLEKMDYKAGDIALALNLYPESMFFQVLTKELAENFDPNCDLKRFESIGWGDDKQGSSWSKSGDGKWYDLSNPVEIIKAL